MRGYKWVLLLLFFLCENARGQFVFIPDSNFASYIKSISLNAIQGNWLDTNNVRIRTFKALDIQKPGIQDLTGIEYFDSLQTLNVDAKIKKVPALPVNLQNLTIDGELDTLEVYSESLKTLNVSGNKIVYIAQLPSGLQKLFLTGNLLHTLNNLNDSLVELWAEGNLLDTLDVPCSHLKLIDVSHNDIEFIQHVPDSVCYLDVSRNNLVTIDNLPIRLSAVILDANALSQPINFSPELKYISAKGCDLNSFPYPIPASVTELDLSSNYIDTVLSIPSSIKKLTLLGNVIKSLNAISDSLKYLDIRFNLITELPDLKNLDTLICTANPLTCLPKLPESLSYIETNVPCIPNKPVAMAQQLYPLCHLAFNYSENNIIPSSCADDTINVLANANNYLWNTGDTLSYVPAACRTSYSCEVTDNNNCYFKDSINLSGNLAVTMGSYSIACDNCLEFAEVRITGGTPPYSYDWDYDNGFVMNHHLPGVRRVCGEGTLVCNVTDAVSNSASDSVFIAGVQLEGFSASVINPSCKTSRDGYIQVVQSQAGSQPIQLFEIMHAAIGHYEFPVATAQGCLDTVKVDLVADEICYDAKVTVTDCGKCNGSLTACLNGENFNSSVTIIVSDVNGNNYSPYALCQDQLYVCTFIVGDSSLQLEVVTDTLIQTNAACTTIYPGDANFDGVANNLDLLSIGIAYNDTGSVREDTSITWSSHYANDWEHKFFDNVNHKNADCDGNGIINANDTSAIVLNYDQLHFRLNQTPHLFGVPTLFLDLPDTLAADSVYNIPLMLGSSADSAIDFYGLAFSIKYNAGAIETSDLGLFADSSWMGVNESDLIYLQHNDTISSVLDGGITRINHTNRSGYGAVGMLQIKTKKILAPQVIQIGTFNVTGMAASELFLPVNSQLDSVTILPMNCSLSVTANATNACIDYCGASIQLQVNDNIGGLHFDWSQSLFDTTHCTPALIDADELTGLATGNYQCIVTDTLGCADTISVSVVTEENSLAVNANYHLEGCTSCDGFIDLSVTGGYAPYHYDWSSSLFIGNNPDSVEDLVDLCFYFNTFLCHITDSIGCVAQYFLDGPNCGFNYQVDVNDETCAGDNDGSIVLSASNLPTFCPYGYLYNGNGGMVDGSNPVSFTNLSAGSYSVILISPNTCDTVVAPVVINHLPDPLVQVQSILPHCGFCDGSVSVLIDSSGAGTFQNFWWVLSGNPTTTDTNLCAFTDYEYEFTDLNNCFHTGIVNMICDSTVIIGVHNINIPKSNTLIVPNPNNGAFTLLLDKSLSEASPLSIYNSLGDCVYFQLMPAGTNQVAVDINKLPSGLYLCRFTANNRVEQVSFVKE